MKQIRIVLSLALLASACLAAEETVFRYDFTGLTEPPSNFKSHFAGEMQGSTAYHATSETPMGASALLISITSPSPDRNRTQGQAWLESQTGLAPGDYRMTVLCRSSQPVQIGFGIIILGAPYTQVSSPGSLVLSLTPEWREIEWTFHLPPGYEAQPLRMPLMLLGEAPAPCRVLLASLEVRRLASSRSGTDRRQQVSHEERPLIGAIRWDAWHTPWSRVQPGADEGPVRAMELSLGPGRYHRRLPFFAQVVSDSQARIDGYTQKIVDQEIAFAQADGLDYWAFLLYEADSPMSQGLSLYLSSARKQDVRFRAIAGASIFGTAEEFAERSQRLLKLMAEPGYVRVAGARPLLYVFGADDRWVQAWGGWENVRLFDRLREMARETGHGTPYTVAMNNSADDGRSVAEAIGADAITTYAIAGDGGREGTP